MPTVHSALGLALALLQAENCMSKRCKLRRHLADAQLVRRGRFEGSVPRQGPGRRMRDVRATDHGRPLSVIILRRSAPRAQQGPSSIRAGVFDADDA